MPDKHCAEISPRPKWEKERMIFFKRLVDYRGFETAPILTQSLLF